MRLLALSLLTTLASVAYGDVKFTSPAAGASLPGGGSINVQWVESNTAPSISTFSTYQLFLMAGGNDGTSMQQLYGIVNNPAPFTNGNKAVGTVPVGIGGTGTNAYFLKMISVSKEGGTVINYSNRFSLTGMTGTFAAAVQAGVTSNAGATAGPATENDVSNNAGAGAGAGAGAAGGAFTIPYQLQTGLTKYAPMQPVPPTKITVKKYTPLHPTSAVSIAKTYLGLPSIKTTMTLSQTFSVSSIENTVAAASQPTGDMARFLARWKD